MVPIGSMVNIRTTYGPDPVIRYNGYPAADLIGDADPRVLSSSQAMAQLEAMSQQILPNGMNIEWTDLSGHGAGAEVRGVTGITVFSGMLGVTLFGLFLTPVFYVTLRLFVTRGKAVKDVMPA